MMKFFLALSCLIVAASAIDKEFMEEVKKKMRENVQTCAKEVSASQDDIDAIFSHKMPASHEGKCVFFCIHKIYGAQREDGSLDMEGALKNLDVIKDMDPDLHEKVSTVFKNCESTPSDSDPCVFASNLVECVVKEGTAIGLKETVIE